MDKHLFMILIMLILLALTLVVKFQNQKFTAIESRLVIIEKINKQQNELIKKALDVDWKTKKKKVFKKLY